MTSAALHPAFGTAYAAIFFATLWLARTRPPWAAAVLTGIVPFALYTHLPHTDLTLAKFALVGALAGVISTTSARSAIGRLRRGVGAPLLYALAATVVVTAASIAVASYHEAALRQTLKACQFLALFAVTGLLAKDDPEPSVMAAAAATLTVSLEAIAQVWTGSPSVLVVSNVIVPRAAGPIEGPNQLSGYLDVALPLLFAFSIRNAAPQAAKAMRRANATKLLYLAALFAGSAAMILTLSRAGIATAAVALAAVALWMRPATATTTATATGTATATATATATTAAAAAAALAALRARIGEGKAFLALLAAIAGRADTENVGTVGTRSELWHAAVALWQRHTVLGVGAGNFELELDRVGLHGVRTHANSAYLQALAETGVIGLIVFLALTLASILPYAKRAPGNALCAAAAAGSIALALHGIVDLLTFFEKVGQFWICVCALPACWEPSAASAPLQE